MAVEGHERFKRYLSRPTWVEIDLDALEHNVRAVQRLIKPKKLVGVLKGNACGLGVAQCGFAMDEAGIDMLAVVNPAEASLLRNRGVKCPIILYPSFGKSQLDEVVNLGAILSVSDREMASDISEAVARCGHGPLQVVLKVDTGMGRLGEPYELAAELAYQIAANPNLQLVGIHSHMAGVTGDMAQEQYDCLEMVARDIESHGVSIPLKMIASSAYVGGYSNTWSTAIDPGRLLFGLKVPTNDPVPDGLLRPVFSALRTELIQVKAVAENDRYASAGDVTRYGVIPFGWYDVALPDFYQKTEALVLGKPVEFLMRPSTQHSVIDLSSVPEAAAGDVVTIIGDGTASNSLAKVASAGNLLENEVTRRFSAQLSYVYFRNGRPSIVTTPAGDRIIP